MTYPEADHTADSHTRAWDVIVVGAGATGAILAWKIASAGARVLVLEAGPERDRLDMVGSFARSVQKGSSSPYIGVPADLQAPSPREEDERTPEAGHYRQTGPSPFRSTYERLSGGSTWHFLGNAPRMLPADFKLSTLFDRGADWPITYDDLEPWYAQAETELGVSGDKAEWEGLAGAYRSTEFPMPPIWSSYGDTVVASTLDRHPLDGRQVRVRRTPQARNSRPYQGRPPCAGNSSCVPICPIAAKYDATVHIKRAAKLPGSPVEFRNQCVVTSLASDASGRIVSVEFDHWAGENGRRRDQASADFVVLAAHAIETPLLMLASKLAPNSPVGRYLMDHPQGFVTGLTPEPVFPFRGPPVVSGIDEFRDGPFRTTHGAFRISIGNDGWGRREGPNQTVQACIFDQHLLGRQLREELNNRITRMLRMSYSTEMLPDPNNRVELDRVDSRGNPRPRISFSLSDYTEKAFHAANRVCGEAFERLGARDIGHSYPPVTAFSGAGHIMGTCRMGTDRNNSVTNSFGRVHDHPNLYIAGAALFPTCGTANPTLTAVALALRTADHLRGQL